MRALVAFIAVAVAGCSTTPITRIVHVVHTTYIQPPPSLLVPCPKADPNKLKTNGDLLDAFLRDQAALTTCNGQLHAIKTLTPPPATG